jgi:hypothetical protein
MTENSQCSRQATVNLDDYQSKQRCIWETTKGENVCPLHQSEPLEREPGLIVADILRHGSETLSPAGREINRGTTFLDIEIDETLFSRGPLSALKNSSSGNRIIFSKCNINDTHMGRTEIGSELHFQDCNIKSLTINVDTSYDIIFKNCDIDSMLINGEMSRVQLDHCCVTGKVEFAGSIEELKIRKVTGEKNGYCLITGEIDSGVLAQPDANADLVYIYDNATVGDIELENAESPLYNCYLFLGTDFDGTKFNRWSSVLTESGYKLFPGNQEFENLIEDKCINQFDTESISIPT